MQGFSRVTANRVRTEGRAWRQVGGVTSVTVRLDIVAETVTTVRTVSEI